MSGEFPFTASAKANCMGNTRGFVKVFERNGTLVDAISSDLMLAK